MRSSILNFIKQPVLIYTALLFHQVSADKPSNADEFPRPVAPVRVEFLPGDAFFKVKLPAGSETSFFNAPSQADDGLKQESNVHNGNDIVFEYDTAEVRVGHLPVYRFGFNRCRIVEFDEKRLEFFKTSILLAFKNSQESLRDSNAEKKSKPIRNITVLIVNKDFSFEDNHLLVRYNNIWDPSSLSTTERETLLKLSLSKDAAWNYIGKSLYQPHVWHPDAVIEDLYQANQISGLRVHYPRMEPKRNPPFHCDEAVEISFDDIAIVVLPTGDPYEVFQKSIDKTFFIARSEGAFRCRLMSGQGEDPFVMESVRVTLPEQKK